MHFTPFHKNKSLRRVNYNVFTVAIKFYILRFIISINLYKRYIKVLGFITCIIASLLKFMKSKRLSVVFIVCLTSRI